MPTNPLSLPRILCLHGGGVTGDIFEAQSRALIAALSTRFRFVFADGPFFCNAGPGIIPVYEDLGPFRRWLRWLDSHTKVDAEAVIDEINYSIETAKNGDEGTGPWVALMGFSQGAKVAASLLFEQQLQEEKLGQAKTEYKFAVLMAGRSPLMIMSDLSEGAPSMLSCDKVSEGFEYKGEHDMILRIPTIHVHGLKDNGLHLHRRLMSQYCDPKTSTLVEWDGDHRVPITKADVNAVVQAILKVGDEQKV